MCFFRVPNVCCSQFLQTSCSVVKTYAKLWRHILCCHPFFHICGSLCELIEGEQSASTTSYLCKRKCSSLTNRISQSAENPWSLLNEKEVSCRWITWAKNKLAHGGKKQWEVLTRVQSGTTHISHLSVLISLSVCDQRIYNPSEAKGELPKIWSVLKLPVFFHWDSR